MADARRQIRASTVIRQNENVPWSTIGTALDYRIRYYFGITPAHELAAYYGARSLTNDQPIPRSVCLGAYSEGDDIIVFDLNSGKELITGSAESSYFHGGGLDEEMFMEAVNLGTVAANDPTLGCTDPMLLLKPEYRKFFGSLGNVLSSHSPIGTKLPKS